MDFQPNDNEDRQQRRDRASNPMKRDASTAPRPGKGKRTRTGCLTCRARKVKCDERPGRCRNCERVMLECKWPELRDVSSIKAQKASTEQRRASTASATPRSRQNACYACRTARCRCSRDRPICIRCREQGVRCDYDSAGDGETVASISAIDTTNSSTTNSNNDLPPAHASESDHEQRRGRNRTTSLVRSTDNISRDVLDEHINAFFQCVYPCQANAFIHRGTLVRDVQLGRVNRMLVLALCAVASRFTPSNDSHSHLSLQGSPVAQDWAREAKALLILEDGMTTDTVATALLLAKHDINSGRYETAWMLSSIASRAALALGLHKQRDDNLTWTEQETRRRLFWACYCLDRMMSTGVPEYALIRTERVRIQLPCEDHNYLLGIPCVTPVPYLEVEEPDSALESPGRAAADREVGLFGHYVQLMGMRYMILGYTRNRDESSQQLSPWEPASIFSQCVRKMTAWYGSLQPQFQLLSDTIFGRVAQNQLTALIMLHVMYHVCMLDLHRVTMPGFPESLPSSSLLGAPMGWVEHHQRACVEHARSIGKAFDIVAYKIDTRDLVLFDASLPIYVFEAMQVQVQWLFMLPVEARAETVADLRASFERLMGYVERMTRYFRQAQWLLREMRKMLLRHGIPVRGGSEYNPHDTSGAQTPHHPWQRRVQSLRRSSETATSSHLNSTLVNSEDYGSPYTQTTHSHQEMLNVPPPNFDGSSFAPSMNESQPLPPKPTIGAAGSEIFDQEDMMMILGRYQEGHVMAEMSGFLGTFGGWTANGVEAGLGAHVAAPE